MKCIKYILFCLISLFSSCIVFADNEVIVKSITPVYDDNSTIIVNKDNSVIFNDKNQEVRFKIVLENTTDKDLTIENIDLSKTSQEFLVYNTKELDENYLLKSKSVGEVEISLSTVELDGWGHNFDDELTASFSFTDAIINPNTATKSILIVLLFILIVTCVLIVNASNKKFIKYYFLLIMLASFVAVTKAKDNIVLSLKFNASFVSQNIMERAYDDGEDLVDYWSYAEFIKNVYIQDELKDIVDYEYKFDVSEKNDGRVLAYLVANENDSYYYDLYLQSDGLVYFNSDATWYFAFMKNLESINNLSSVDTSNVTNMYQMFMNAGEDSEEFDLDVSNFDTSNVTDMNGMFKSTGYKSESFTLDVSNFDTSNVTDMSHMFDGTGHNSTNFVTSITISNSNLTDYNDIFSETASSGDSKIAVRYTDETIDLVKDIIKNESNNSNIVFGKVAAEIEEISVGDEIHISGEVFNVIREDDETVTLFAQYNLGTDYRQSKETNYIIFSNKNGWVNQPGPKEIDVLAYNGPANTYISEYKTFLQNELLVDEINVDLMSLMELKELGCKIVDDYSYLSDLNCSSSPHVSWIINNQKSWLKSASSEYNYILFTLDFDGTLDNNHYKYMKQGIRPVVTISKDVLKTYLSD